MMSWHEVRSRLTWSLAGGIVAATLILVGTVVAARLLGPARYGEVAFAMAAAQFVSVLVVHGMDFASARALARQGSPGAHATIVSTSLASVGVFGLVIAFVGWVAVAPLSDRLGASGTSIRGAAVLVGLYALKAVLDRQLAALGLLDFQARSRSVEGIAVLGGLALLVSLQRVTSTTVIGILCAGVAVMLLVNVIRLRKLVNVAHVKMRAHRELRTYGRVVLLSTIVPLPLLYGDRFSLEYATSPRLLGIYMAYFTSSVLIGAQLLLMVNNVLFPIVAAASNYDAIASRIKQIADICVMPFIFVFAGAMLVSLHLFGSQYPVYLQLVLGFSALAALQLRNGLVHMLVMGHSRRIFALEVRWTATRSLAFCAYLICLVRTEDVSIIAVVAGLIASEFAEALVLRSVLRRARKLDALEGPRHAITESPSSYPLPQ